MNKKRILILLAIAAAVGGIFISLSMGEKEALDMKKTKTLIVYYSRTGNTKVVAELIQAEVGGDLAQIETKQERPSNYREEVAQNEREQNEAVLPELKSAIPDFESYDRIFIGAPTWNMALPQAVVAFMDRHDFTGKTVIPFNTNGGYGAGSSFEQIRTGVKGARTLEGFSVEGGRETDGVLLDIEGQRKTEVSREIATWLEKIGQ